MSIYMTCCKQMFIFFYQYQTKNLLFLKNNVVILLFNKIYFYVTF